MSGGQQPCWVPLQHKGQLKVISPVNLTFNCRNKLTQIIGIISESWNSTCSFFLTDDIQADDFLTDVMAEVIRVACSTSSICSSVWW